MKLKVLLRPEPEGGSSVALPALPGCYSRGDTREEALANAREAAQANLEVADGQDPFPTPPGARPDLVGEIEL
jgi:antitoxin HicB